MNQDYVTENSQKSRKEPKIIKRYGNRKLYDTEQSSYVVLSDIAKMIRNNEEVRVIDNETKDDITSTTFTQIIFGAEKTAICSAPLNILKNIIMKGDGSLSNFLAELGLFKPTPKEEKSITFSGKTTAHGASSLEERLTSSVATSSHDIIEENELPELPNANRNLDHKSSSE